MPDAEAEREPFAIPSQNLQMLCMFVFSPSNEAAKTGTPSARVVENDLRQIQVIAAPVQVQKARSHPNRPVQFQRQGDQPRARNARGYSHVDSARTPYSAITPELMASPPTLP